MGNEEAYFDKSRLRWIIILIACGAITWITWLLAHHTDLNTPDVPDFRIFAEQEKRDYPITRHESKTVYLYSPMLLQLFALLIFSLSPILPGKLLRILNIDEDRGQESGYHAPARPRSPYWLILWFALAFFGTCIQAHYALDAARAAGWPTNHSFFDDLLWRFLG